MEIIVGKQGSQKITISDSTVSRKHCKLTEQADGTFLLEDLGSTNGTFVDGRKVIQTIVSRETMLTLGTYCVKVDALVGPKPEDYTHDFEKLKEVYEKYHSDLIELEKSDRLKNFYRSLPPTLSAIVFAIALFLDGDSAIILRSLMGVITIAFIIWATTGAFKNNKKTPEIRQRLFKQFQIDYVCPKCKHYLGDIPYENLQNRGNCDYCKCRWTKE